MIHLQPNRMSQPHDVLIIGTGITGLSAAKHSLQNGLSTVTMEALLPGGLVTNVNELDGEIQGSGSDIAAALMLEVHKLGAKNINATAASIERDAEMLAVTSDAGRHLARTVIIASGARLRRLGIPGEAEFEDRGVSHCADCDGPFYKDQNVVVVGGGDSAAQEALVLSEFARQVHLVHRGANFKARQHLVDRLTDHPNIVIHWRAQVEAVLGDRSVRAVRVREADGPAAGEISCTGFFPYVGLEPSCEFVPEAVLRDAGGLLLTDANLRTAMPGVFAAGAVRSGFGGLLKHSVAEGVTAAESACAFIRS